ncbi:MAG: hypothetical protein RLY31_2230 [Bacteroidota bacterium]
MPHQAVEINRLSARNILQMPTYPQYPASGSRLLPFLPTAPPARSTLGIRTGTGPPSSLRALPRRITAKQETNPADDKQDATSIFPNPDFRMKNACNSKMTASHNTPALHHEAMIRFGTNKTVDLETTTRPYTSRIRQFGLRPMYFILRTEPGPAFRFPGLFAAGKQGRPTHAICRCRCTDSFLPYCC